MVLVLAPGVETLGPNMVPLSCPDSGGTGADGVTLEGAPPKDEAGVVDVPVACNPKANPAEAGAVGLLESCVDDLNEKPETAAACACAPLTCGTPNVGAPVPAVDEAPK